MKKSLHITFLDFDDIKNHLLSGGQARATFEIARRLIKLGHAVTVICSRYPGSKDLFNEGIFYKHIGLGSPYIRLNNAFFFFALPFAVFKNRADVIIEAFTAPISTCFSPLFTNIPVIGMPTMFEAKEFAKKYHLPFHWIERFGARFYDYFLAYSPLNKMKMEQLNPKIITRVIPNGVDESLFDISAKEGGYAGFIGRIDITQKGLDLLLEACRIARDKLSVKVLIAGNGSRDEERKLAEMIKEKNLADMVSFVGRVDGMKKIDFLSNASFGICPSRFEDFPLVPLEWTALGKPVVCFDIPGLVWLDRSVALKAPTFSVEELADCLIRMDGVLDGGEMKNNCRPFARKYGWNEIAKEYADFCMDVIALEKRKKLKARKKILILGGAGFIGSTLSTYLYARGDNVVIFDKLLYDKENRNFFPANCIKGDIRNRDELVSAVKNADAVVHLAALSNDPASDLDPKATWEINYIANKDVAEVCKKFGKRLVYASSCSVYGFNESETFDEESELHPVTLYAKTKALSEKAFFDSGADAIILRFATAYGYTPKPRFDLVVNIMTGNAYFNRQINVNGGSQWRPLVHVKDIARAIELAIETKNQKYRIFNVGSNDQNFTISELAKRIAAKFVGVTVVEQTDSIDNRSYKVNFDRIERELGFRAEHTLETAVNDFLRAFRNNEISGLDKDEYYRIKYLKNNYKDDCI